MKVYVTFDCDYSARCATGVFTSKEEAAAKSDDVDEFELDETAGHRNQKGWLARIALENGDWMAGGRSEHYGPVGEIHCRHWDGVKGWSPGYVEAFSPISAEHALKCAAEYRQSILREGLRNQR